MRLSGLPGQLRDSLLGLAGAFAGKLAGRYLAGQYLKARHLTRPAQRKETDINQNFLLERFTCVHI